MIIERLEMVEGLDTRNIGSLKTIADKTKSAYTNNNNNNNNNSRHIIILPFETP